VHCLEGFSLHKFESGEERCNLMIRFRLYKNMSDEPRQFYRWEINSRPALLGGGWQMRLFDVNGEARGYIFPISEDTEEARAVALAFAMGQGETWLRGEKSEGYARDV
jgi:hypothetical protein